MGVVPSPPPPPSFAAAAAAAAAVVAAVVSLTDASVVVDVGLYCMGERANCDRTAPVLISATPKIGAVLLLLFLLLLLPRAVKKDNPVGIIKGKWCERESLENQSCVLTGCM